MIIQATFDYSGKHFVFCRPFSELDRNYNDEEFAYFLERVPGTDCGLFEINVFKDVLNGNLKEDGYVGIYENGDEVMPANILKARIGFWYL